MINGVSKDQAYFDMVDEQLEELDNQRDWLLNDRELEKNQAKKETLEKTLKILENKRQMLIKILEEMDPEIFNFDYLDTIPDLFDSEEWPGYLTGSEKSLAIKTNS
jgi:hypothetical protein